MPVREHRFEAVEAEVLQRCGPAWVAGIDEAGRGPLAGPVSVGLCIFEPDFFFQAMPEELAGLRDSKRCPPNRRAFLQGSIRRLARFSTTVLAGNRLIDRMGISRAIEWAILAALERARRAGCLPRAVLFDGKHLYPALPRTFPEVEFQTHVGGDDRILSIAAASILAKECRDRRMQRYDRLFPGYDLPEHKGYATRAHRDALERLGPSPLHRRTFLGFLKPDESQPELDFSGLDS